jgi:hypothetical protein
MAKNIRIGIENFKTLIDSEYCYVDKTGLIADLVNFVVSDEKTDAPVRKSKPALDGVSLFLRPRRFGKTLTLSMLKYFFDIDEKDNAYLFEGLAISKEKEICEQFQNRFPVIFLTLKDVKGRNEDSFLSKFNYCLKDEYKRHAYAKSSLTDKNDIATFERLSVGDGTKDDFTVYLSLLVKALYSYHKVKPIVLIDEYDVPLNTAHQNGCYDYVVDIISEMFSLGLKTNDNLQAGIITGCLQIAKNQIFTGLNNPGIYSVTNPVYAQYFGFTKEETAELLHTYGLDDRADDVKDNYDGYNIGEYSMYNPFSLLKFIESARCDHSTVCRNYWAATSGDALLREMLASSAGKELKETFETLLSGNDAKDIKVDDTIVYDTMMDNKAAVMGTLLFSGYLTVVKAQADGDYTLRIPNREVLSTFKGLVDQYNKTVQASSGGKLLRDFTEGNVPGAETDIGDSLKRIISLDDLRKDKEYFMHGFLLGSLVDANGSGPWVITSQKESGDGYADITLEDSGKRRVVIIEVKQTGEKDIEKGAEGALAQIERMRYAVKYESYAYHIMKYGVCFHGKQVSVKMAETSN